MTYLSFCFFGGMYLFCLLFTNNFNGYKILSWQVLPLHFKYVIPLPSVLHCSWWKVNCNTTRFLLCMAVKVFLSTIKIFSLFHLSIFLLWCLWVWISLVHLTSNWLKIFDIISLIFFSFLLYPIFSGISIVSVH